MIRFNVPPQTKNGIKYIKQVIASGKSSGDGVFTTGCSRMLEGITKVKKVLMTTSCSSALDMVAILLNIKSGDEIIMPSFTFVSTANAFVLRGAKIVFVDIRPDTMNIDENKIEAAITIKTKAIVVVHYAGVACEMDTIMNISKNHNIPVIEDAAQAIMSTYKGRMLGTIGDMGCYSFHETKNLSMGEGGALLINIERYVERSEIIREKGTNRNAFFRGEIDKYSWVDIGSSYLPSELNCAYLLSQLEIANEITLDRLATWDKYYQALLPLQEKGLIELPRIPEKCNHNAHMFYLKVMNLEERSDLIAYLRENEIGAVFHYVPLHSAKAGVQFGRFDGNDIYTTKESERILRLPIFYRITSKDSNYIISVIFNYFEKNALK